MSRLSTTSVAKPRLVPACTFILLAAALGAFLFNALMPQGIGFLPEEIKKPLWRPASLTKAKSLYDERALFVDARDPGQYKLGHVRGAVNLPPDEYKLFYTLLAGQIKAAKKIVVYGRSFSRFPAAVVAPAPAKRGRQPSVGDGRTLGQVAKGRLSSAGAQAKEAKMRSAGEILSLACRWFLGRAFSLCRP